MLGGANLLAGLNRRKTTNAPKLPPTTNVKPIFHQPIVDTKLNTALRSQIVKETKEREDNLPLLTIFESTISLYSWEEMRSVGRDVKITKTGTVGNCTVGDSRMGPITSNVACDLCSNIDCTGHFGLIEFVYPIYNPCFVRDIVSVLACVCNYCGGILITEDLIREKGINRVPFNRRLAELEKQCIDRPCLRQNLANTDVDLPQGPIRQCKMNPKFITTSLKEDGIIMYEPKENIGVKRQEGTLKPQFLSIERVIETLSQISEADAALLGFSKGSHPINMIMYGMLVPPNIARPPVLENGKLVDDKLTIKLSEIVGTIHKINTGRQTVTDLYRIVRSFYFDTDSKKMTQNPFEPIIKKIQGKEALIRGLLMGKRNDQCGRTVAGPNPALQFGHISIPQYWKAQMTKIVKVNHLNINAIRDLAEAGKVTHVISKQTGLKRWYDKKYAQNINIGDSVKRWLETGDWILANRQPTLHRQSLMGHELILSDTLTIGMHLSYTSPMNLDFDGDEINCWNPQSVESDAEARILMSSVNNVMSSEQNKPMMGLVMNSVTGSFILTTPGVYVNDNLFGILLGLITIKEPLKTLSYRLAKYGVHPRSGAAVFSAILPEDFYYNNKGVLILDGVLVSGRITKSHVGPSHRSIIQELWTNPKYGRKYTTNFLTVAPWIINKWLIERGFTVGLSDVVNLAKDEATGEEYDANLKVLEKELAKMYVQIEALGPAIDDPLEEEYRMKQIKSLVNNSDGIGIRLANETLKGNNAIGIMTERGAGTKGAIANIAQIMGAVGQQNFRGSRLPATLTNGTRTLPCFDPGDNSPEAHAFIPQSFTTGLTSNSVFFMQAGGREGLLDTATKTAETGNIQRKMVKAFENIIVDNEGSIGNTIGNKFAPVYGSGYSVSETMFVPEAGTTDFSSFIDIVAVVAELNLQRGWVPKSVKAAIDTRKAELPEIVDTILPNDVPKRPTFSKRVVDLNQSVIPDRKSKLTQFEKARIVGSRAKQIENNAVPLVDVGDIIDPVTIAMMEYDAGVCPVYVIRSKTGEVVRPTLDKI